MGVECVSEYAVEFGRCGGCVGDDGGGCLVGDEGGVCRRAEGGCRA